MRLRTVCGNRNINSMRERQKIKIKPQWMGRKDLRKPKTKSDILYCLRFNFMLHCFYTRKEIETKSNIDYSDFR